MPVHSGHYDYVNEGPLHQTHQEVLVVSHANHQSHYYKHYETNGYFPCYFVKTFIHRLICPLLLPHCQVIVTEVVVEEFHKQPEEKNPHCPQQSLAHVPHKRGQVIEKDLVFVFVHDGAGLSHFV